MDKLSLILKKIPIANILAFLSFISLNLYNIYSNHLIEKFNSSYLHAFGISSNIQIENITTHSKIIVFIIFTLGSILISYLINNLFKFLTSKKIIHYITFFILCFIIVYLFWLVFLIYLMCIENYYPLFDVINLIFFTSTVYIVSLIMTLFITLSLIIMKIIQFFSKEKNKENSLSLSTTLCIFSIYFIIAFDLLSVALGESYAKLETYYPSFELKNNNEQVSSGSNAIQYIVIAKIKDTNYLIAEADTISKDNTVYQIFDIKGIELTDVENPLSK